MTAAPPLGICTGVVEPGVAFGGFGPASAFAWRGSCVGGCGGRPMCAEDYPRPECSGCMRTRHGVTDVLTSPWRPAVHALGAGFVPTPPRRSPDAAPTVSTTAILRPATEVSHVDPSLPRSVRTLAELRPGTRITLAVHAVAGLIGASLAVRAPGIGYAVYVRLEGGAWAFKSAVALGRVANVGQFAAALRGEAYVPPAPRPPAELGQCPRCEAEVRLTKDGAIYASHRCTMKTIEGRS